jgi:hypothetical protein
MIARFIAAATLAASLIAVPAGAQTAAELLQKGIYAQETAGDADGAIRIYRQVIASPRVARTEAAEAQARIAGALLQKGEMAGASLEFGKLARDYPEQAKLVNSMAQRLRTIAANGPSMVLGAVQDGKYRHFWTGVEFAVPAGWSFTTQKAESNGGDRVDLMDSNAKAKEACVRIAREINPPERVAGRLLDRYQYKLKVLRTPAAGYLEYHLRPDSPVHRTVGGQQAWSYAADYIDAKGAKMSEYVVFVQSEKNSVYFSLIAAAADFAGVQAQFEPVVQSLLMP